MTEKKQKAGVVEMTIAGILLDPAIQAPVIVLKSLDDKIQLPIWIGMSEATAIAATLKQLTLNRPLTHDLFISTLEAVGAKVEQALITSLVNATYFAELVLSFGEQAIILDCRPSDALAIAIRAGAPIYVTNEVLKAAEQSGSNTKGEPLVDVGENEEQSEENILLKDLQYVDKNKWEEILKKLDIEDFKYKA